MSQILVKNSYTELYEDVITGLVADTASQIEKETDGCGLHIMSLRNSLSYRKVTVSKDLRLSSGNISPCPFSILNEHIILRNGRNTWKCPTALELSPQEFILIYATLIYFLSDTFYGVRHQSISVSLCEQLALLC
jgi:hypothetical protein